MFSPYEQPGDLWIDWRTEWNKKNRRKTVILWTGIVIFLFGLVASISGITIYVVYKDAEKVSDVVKVKVPDKPSIVFIAAEGVGWNDIWYGDGRARVHSPNIANLARNGRTLLNHYVQPDSIGTQHAFLTGSLPFKTKMQHGPKDDAAPYCTGSDLTLLSGSLKELGYDTHAFGRWGLGFCDAKCTPLSRGFDHFYGHYTEQPNGTTYDWVEDYDLNYELRDSGRFYTELLADRVIRTINDATEPFFIYVAFSDLHNHLQIPAKYTFYYGDCDGINSFYCLYMDEIEERRRNTERRNYLGMITAVDAAVGRIKTALGQNTITIFTSDTGGSREGYADNLPLRGAGGTLYEGGTRTHGIVSSPLFTTTSDQHKGLFHATDWAPTIISIAGGVPIPQHDGYNQTDMVLYGLPSKRDVVVYNIDLEDLPILGQSAIRNNKWKLIWGFAGLTDGRGSIETPFYLTNRKLNVRTASWDSLDVTKEKRATIVDMINDKVWTRSDLPSGSTKLYDLQVDPNEYNDVSGNISLTPVIVELKTILVNNLNQYESPPASFSEPRTYNPTRPGWCSFE